MVLWLMLACSSGLKEAPTAEPTAPPEEEPPDLPGTGGSDWGEVDVDPAVPTDTRQLKRMTVRQVRDSMEQISGGIVWGGGTVSDWNGHFATLGVADYQLRVESDREPSVMFQKFLDDAASDTCRRWILGEGGDFHTIDDPDSTAQADIRANILGLRWKIQGRARVDGDAIIDDYVSLYTSVRARTDSSDHAWGTVCQAMFTHPDFFMY